MLLLSPYKVGVFLSWLAFALSFPVKADHSAPNSPVTAESQNDKCEDRWKKWLERYAGNSIFTSISKSTPYRYNAKQIDAAIDQKEKILLEEPIPVSGKEVSMLDLHDLWRKHLESEKAARELYARLREKRGDHLQDDRDELIATFMHHIVRGNSPDNLLIFEVGMKHAVDFNLLENSPGVVFAGQQLDGNTRVGSPSLYRLHELLKNDPVSWDIFMQNADFQYREYWKKDSPHAVRLADTDVLESMYSLPLVSIASTRAIERNRFTSASFLNHKVPERPEAIVAWEGHILDGRIAISELPDAACLKKLGYSKVTWVAEGHVFVGKQRIKALDPLFVFPPERSRTTVKAKRLRDLKQSNPEAFELISSGDAEPSISVFQTRQKLQKLEAQGIQVDVMGLELSPSIYGPEINALREWWSKGGGAEEDRKLLRAFPMPKERDPKMP